MIEGRRVEYEPVLSNEPDTPIGEGGRFPYARFVPAKHGNYVEPNYLGYSDYGGSQVERSNVRVFEEQFAEHQGEEWWELYGAHGTTAIVVRIDADERVPEIGEFIDALESYPVADESDLSNAEMEAEEEAWNDYGRSDFRYFLEQMFNDGERGTMDEIPNLFPRKFSPIVATFPIETQVELLTRVLALNDPEELEDSYLNDIFYAGMRNGNGGEVTHEEGGSVHFRYEDVVRSYIQQRIDSSGFSVLMDALLETGGEWSPMADRLLVHSLREIR